MSKQLSDHTIQRPSSDFEGRFDTSRSTFDIRGPIDPNEDHEHTDHFALIYEDRAEQFDAAVPFIEEGLERGERCIYVADDNTVDEVLAAMRSRGVDVDTALESGALSVHTEAETYRRTGEFDRDAMRSFWEETLADATDDEFAGLRAAAEMTWALEADDTGFDDLCEYEELLNPLYNDDDYAVLCQYNRNRFPAEILHNVLRTHPFLVHDDTTVCQNFYYTPPEEYFGPDNPSRELDRKLATLVDRTDARTTIETHERYQRELYEIIATPHASFDEKIAGLLELGRERLGLEIGYFTETIDENTFEIVDAVGAHENIRPGVTDSLCETYCEKLLASPGRIAVRDAAEAGWTDDPAYERFGLDAYFGTTIHVGGETYGTLCFGSETTREVPYTDAERTFLDLMGQLIEYELERQRRERFLRESSQITSDPNLDFEEKLQALFELGCEQFGLELGVMATVDSDDDRFEVEYVSDTYDGFEPGLELPLSETYCATVAGCDTVGSVDDPVEAGYDDLYVYRELDMKTYLGTYIEVEGDVDRTFFFVSEEPHDGEFSDDERTFQRLLGQWVKYELQRRQREAFLQESYRITADPDRDFDEKLEELLELGREWFGLEMGGLNHLPSRGGEFRLEKGVGLGVDDDDELWSDPGYGCFCRRTIESDDPVAMTDVHGTDWQDDAIHREFGLTSYLGTRVTDGSTPYGTFWFGSTEPRDRPFSETERTFIELLGQWISYELEREQREHHQQTLSRIAADPSRSFEAKLGDLFELGCERFDLEIGGIAEIDPASDSFKVQAIRGDHDQLQPGAEAPLSETYCRETVDHGAVADITDPERTGFGDSIAYEEFGVETYLGTRIELENEPDRTFFFVSTDARDREFTQVERTFLHLMSQWIAYELERTQRERALEESNERLEQFAYAASHDLQEPLRMVTSYLQLLENRYGDAFDEDGEEFLDFAVDGADRMREMIDGLLAYSRVETQGDPFEPVDLDALLEDVREDLQIQIEETDATIATDGLPRVSGDASQLRQVLQNLLENAIQYSDDTPPRVRIDATRRGREWVISVEDDGIGIDPDDQDRVFTVFDRLHSREEYDGTGIGLALCQRIVERHGGDIWVDAEPGDGSTFSFTLPAVRE
ncbi:GAF sensor signal transduction histidine kinase [Haloterrigena salina JCM 13891]|uniref:histidine kinase n=1 Tax=Haloterrigena salina JCM 13891 TaxID=1227488 RepID=M0CMM6_9EURY|nr:MEDS domain-containing protein [Haloterrigena salina]ELZ23893.1 GAF sensor signal transduction histidine kinase [Haloterrigena salina JCM 13891]